MPKLNLPKGPQTGICRLCSQAITRDGKCGWYHDARNLGTVRGIQPHFAEPMTTAVA